MPNNRLDKLVAASKMTHRQLEAISIKIDPSTIIQEIASCRQYDSLSRASNPNLPEINKWLINGWNTEYILNQTPVYFNEEEIVYALQWAFPQAYYSVFAVTNAFFNAMNNTSESHAKIIKHFSENISQNRYPEYLSYWADGGKNTITTNGVSHASGENSLAFNRNRPDLVEHQIAQFLTATRKLDLQKRRYAMRKEFRTKHGGKIKKTLSNDDWSQVSRSLGKTSILSLLYRKRIKSNYRDIDSYLVSDVSAKEIFDFLIKIVTSINIIHEGFLLIKIGEQPIRNVISSISETRFDFVNNRIDSLTSMNN